MLVSPDLLEVYYAEPLKVMWLAVHNAVTRNHACADLDELFTHVETALREEQPLDCAFPQAYRRSCMHWTLKLFTYPVHPDRALVINDKRDDRLKVTDPFALRSH